MTPDREEPSPVIDEVEGLLAEITAAPGGDFRAVLERLCAEHPNHAETLRRRFALAQRMGLLEVLVRAEHGATAEPPERDFGDFRLLKKLGSGGMGVVWLAEQKSLGRRVALKLLRAGLGLTEHSRERFRREALAVSRLDHPGICPLLEAGEVEGTPYLAMRYVVGETLAALLERQRREKSASSSTQDRVSTSSGGARRRITDMIEIVEGIARALDAVHRAGLLHRDIKPANIMLADDGGPLILDFGLALVQTRDLQSLTLPDTVVGTPAYLSPEQILPGKHGVDHRADIYALGVTLYECLTLHLPFDDSTREALYRSILDAEVRNPRRFDRRIPRDVVIVLQKAMDSRREHRYATAREFADDLRRVRLHEPIHARRVGPLVRLGHWMHRKPALSTAVLSAFLLLSVGLVASLLMLGRVAEARNQERQQRQLAEGRRLAAEASERTAQDALAGAFLRMADRANADGDHAAAAVFAAAALLHDPDNPHGPHHRSLADGPGSREASERLALMRSRHFEAEAGRRVERLRVLELPPAQDGTRPRIGRRPVYSPDGAELAVAVEDGSVAIWKLAEAAAPRRFRPPRPCTLQQVAYTGDGRILVGRSEDSLLLWDARAGAFLGELQLGDEHRCLACSPGGQHIAVGYDSGIVRFWRVADRTLESELAASSSALNAIAYSPDGTRLAVLDMAQVAALWSLAESRRIATRHLTHWGTDVRFAPDGSVIAVAAMDNKLWILSGTDGRVLRVIATGDRPVTLDFAPDGNTMVHGGIFTTAAIRPVTGSGVLDVLHDVEERVQNVSYAPDGRTLATGDQGWQAQMRLWQVRENDLTVRRHAHDKVFLSVSISTDGRHLVTAGPDRSLCYWSLPASHEFGAARASRFEYGSAEAATIADGRISPDGRLLAASCKPGEIELRSLPDGNILRVLHDTRDAHDHGCPLAFAPDGTLYFGGGKDGSIRRWSFERDEFAPPLVGHAAAIFALALSPDGSLLASAGKDSTVRIWHLDTGAIPIVLAGRHEGIISGIAFSPDGRQLASSGDDWLICIWDVATGAWIRDLIGHGGWVNQVAYSPDGRLLLSGSDDNTARLWDAGTGQVLQVFSGAEQVVGLCFSPDGSWFYMNDGLDLTRHRVVVHERIEDPQELLRQAEQVAGARLVRLDLVPF